MTIDSDKSPKYMKIKEFAALLGLSISTVRKYEKLGIIKCHHKSRVGGHRYFTQEQADDYNKGNQIVD